MPHYQYINKDPESLLIFLENNIIATGMLGNSTLKNSPENLVLEKSQRKGDIDGRVVDVYYIKKSSETSTRKSLKSYICDYTAGDVEYCTLGSAGNFCFTITMNGCTFGIGSKTSDGTVVVTHANTGGQTGQQQTQTFDTHAQQNSTLTSILEPALYRHMATGLTATTFGIKTSKGWKFYFQLFKTQNGIFKCFGTFPVPTQQFSTPTVAAV